jgi:hypothetical protein
MQLPKIGWVRYRNSREVLGAVRSVTVSQSAGQWFVSITTLREVEQRQHPATSAVGLDWGVASFVSMSNGEVIEQLQPLKKFLPKLTSYNAACKGVVRNPPKRLGCHHAPESCRNPLHSRTIHGGEGVNQAFLPYTRCRTRRPGPLPIRCWVSGHSHLYSDTKDARRYGSDIR